MTRLERIVADSQAMVDSLRARGAPSEADALALIREHAGTASRTRDLEPGADPAVVPVEILLPVDGSLKIVDSAATLGLVLTGKWIIDYGRMIQLQPAYENALAGYRTQSDLNGQLVAEFEGAIEVKDRKIGVLEEMNRAQEERGELYRQLYEASRPGFFERVLHKLAFPVGITVGIIVGAAVAD